MVHDVNYLYVYYYSCNVYTMYTTKSIIYRPMVQAIADYIIITAVVVYIGMLNIFCFLSLPLLYFIIQNSTTCGGN